jgi:hypothetical protein
MPTYAGTVFSEDKDIPGAIRHLMLTYADVR